MIVISILLCIGYLLGQPSVILEKLIRTSNQTCYFKNMQYFNIRYKILPTPFQYYSSYRLLNVVRYGGKIQCLNYLLCDIL